MLTLDFLSNDYKEKKTQAQIVEENIEIDIITGKIPSGKRINERELCETYNMSRTPIREILRRIEGNGLIKSIPNRGVFAVGLNSQSIDDLYYLKTILEVQCVRWAIAVSYTHLDVYKRQGCVWALICTKHSSQYVHWMKKQEQ